MLLRIGDEPITPARLAAAAREPRLRVELTAAARARIAAGRAHADAHAARAPVYGRTTGVGAQREFAVSDGGTEHAQRLLRSHAGGLGDPLPEEAVRATIVARLAQIAAGHGGHRVAVADALATLVNEHRLPVLHDLGGIGTGDLAALGELGLALGAELGEGDALPLMSSNAATLAVATLAWADLRGLLDAGLAVAAQSFRALRGNPEAFAEALGAARPLPGAVAVAARLRALTSDAGAPARLQDPFALRCLPQVGGALHDALGELERVLGVELNAGAENPLVTPAGMLHNGGFHAADLALRLDAARLALVPFGALAVARLAHLLEPRMTGLDAFLAGQAPGSSGLMIAEYMAADALARLRAAAAPALLGGAVLSRGLEEHASFAWQGALQARAAVPLLRTVLALELLAAERALAALEGAALPADAPIAPAVRAAAARLAQLAGAVGEGAAGH